MNWLSIKPSLCKALTFSLHHCSAMSAYFAMSLSCYGSFSRSIPRIELKLNNSTKKNKAKPWAQTSKASQQPTKNSQKADTSTQPNQSSSETYGSKTEKRGNCAGDFASSRSLFMKVSTKNRLYTTFIYRFK